MKEQKVLNRISTVDALTHTFAKEIINGIWEPGDQCKDTVMAEKYGVSRNSVREAFSILVEQGLLKKRANKGFFVPVFDEKEIRELYEARAMIEMAAIEFLAEKREVPAKMYEALESLKAQTTTDLRSCILDADFDFHMGLVEALGNSRVKAMFEKLFREIMIINRQPHLFFSIQFIISEHEIIIETILAGDTEAAKQIIKKHLDVSIDRQIGQMNQKT